MALLDVSKMITLFQKRCQFAEWFTETYREPLSEALAEVFRPDGSSDQPGPDVLSVIDSLIARLRRALEKLVQTETELLAAIKKLTELRNIKERLTTVLQRWFRRARGTCREHFGEEKAAAAGFPARVSSDPVTLMRQTGITSFTLHAPDFELGEDLVPDSNVNADQILNTYEAHAENLREAHEEAGRHETVVAGKQVAKDKMMDEFNTTYRLFVNIVRPSFLLAGQKELAERMTLTERQRTSTREGDNQDDQAPTPPAEGPGTEERQAESPTRPTEPTSSDVAELPSEIVELVEVIETSDRE